MTKVTNYNQFQRQQQYISQLAKVAVNSIDSLLLALSSLKQQCLAKPSLRDTDDPFKSLFHSEYFSRFKSSCCLIYSYTCSSVKVHIVQRLIQTVEIILATMQNRNAMKSTTSSLQNWQLDIQRVK